MTKTISQFKVGDLVKVVDLIDDVELELGQTGVVESIEDCQPFPVWVKLDKTDSVLGFSDKELELLSNRGLSRYDLVKNFTLADVEKAKYVFVRISTPSGNELIVLPRDSWKAKLEFYKKNYSETNLVHNMNDRVSITGLSYGDESQLEHCI